MRTFYFEGYRRILIFREITYQSDSLEEVSYVAADSPDGSNLLLLAKPLLNLNNNW